MFTPGSLIRRRKNVMAWFYKEQDMETMSGRFLEPNDVFLVITSSVETTENVDHISFVLCDGMIGWVKNERMEVLK